MQVWLTCEKIISFIFYFPSFEIYEVAIKVSESVKAVKLHTTNRDLAYCNIAQNIIYLKLKDLKDKSLVNV